MTQLTSRAYETEEGTLLVNADCQNYYSSQRSESSTWKLGDSITIAAVIDPENRKVGGVITPTEGYPGTYELEIECDHEHLRLELTPTSLQPIEVLFETSKRPPNATLRLKRKETFQNRCGDICQVLSSPELSDVRVICGPRDTPAIPHSKLILASASPFFHRMFACPCTESEGLAKDGTIHMPNWSRVGFLFCSIHMYTGWMPTSPLPKLDAIQDCLEAHGRDPSKPLSAMDLVRIVELASLLEMTSLECSANEAAGNQFLKDAKLLKNKSK